MAGVEGVTITQEELTGRLAELGLSSDLATACGESFNIARAILDAPLYLSPSEEEGESREREGLVGGYQVIVKNRVTWWTGDAIIFASLAQGGCPVSPRFGSIYYPIEYWVKDTITTVRLQRAEDLIVKGAKGKGDLYIPPELDERQTVASFIMLALMEEADNPLSITGLAHTLDRVVVATVDPIDNTRLRLDIIKRPEDYTDSGIRSFIEQIGQYAEASDGRFAVLEDSNVAQSFTINVDYEAWMKNAVYERIRRGKPNEKLDPPAPCFACPIKRVPDDKGNLIEINAVYQVGWVEPIDIRFLIERLGGGGGGILASLIRDVEISCQRLGRISLEASLKDLWNHLVTIANHEISNLSTKVVTALQFMVNEVDPQFSFLQMIAALNQVKSWSARMASYARRTAVFGFQDLNKAFKESIEVLKSSFPDLDIRIENLLPEGIQVQTVEGVLDAILNVGVWNSMVEGRGNKDVSILVTLTQDEDGRVRLCVIDDLSGYKDELIDAVCVEGVDKVKSTHGGRGEALPTCRRIMMILTGETGFGMKNGLPEQVLQALKAKGIEDVDDIARIYRGAAMSAVFQPTLVAP